MDFGISPQTLHGRTHMSGFPLPLALMFLATVLAMSALSCRDPDKPAQPAEPVAAVMHAKNTPRVGEVASNERRVVFEP